ncbi:MAG: hypothetical protein ACI8ZB_000709 [Desulforhopalus sp.]|jgi:hypothetical protein
MKTLNLQNHPPGQFSSFFICLFCVLLFTLALPSKSYCKDNANENLIISLELDQASMKNIVEIISKQTGYTVELDESLDNILVSGHYNSIKLETFLQRALKGSNSFFVISADNKTIIVKTATSQNNTPIRTPPKRKKAKSQEERQDNIISQPLINKTSPNIAVTRKNPLSTNNGIHELNNNFSTTRSGNQKHLIDPQTDKSWEDIEKQLQQ